MAAVILSFVLTLLLAGSTWLILGSRLSLTEAGEMNDLANLGAYGLSWLPIAFVVVFFGIG